MASKRHVRQVLQRRQCGTKKQYATVAEAKAAAQTLFLVGVSGSQRMWPYRCPFCKAFHIGHHKP